MLRCAECGDEIEKAEPGAWWIWQHVHPNPFCSGAGPRQYGVR